MAGAQQLAKIPFVLTDDKGDTRKPEKITLAELTQFRGKTIDETIKDLVDEHLSRSNFNNIEEIGAALNRMGLGTLDSMGLRTHATNLIALMKRRHWIVHRVDYVAAGHRGDHDDVGEPKARPILAKTVNVWKDCVRAVGFGILDALEQKS
jgi:hypothetical protein